MKEPRTPDRKKGGRRPVLAKESSNAKLFADDYVTVGKLIKSWGKTESEVIRIIVYDWLRANRVRALGQDEAAEAVRGVYERVVSEQVAPLVRGIEEIKRALALSEGKARMISVNEEADASAYNGEFRELIDGVRALVEQAASDLSESGVFQLERIERLERAVALGNALLGETFASVWSARDWVIRFLVEVDMFSRNKSPDEVEDAVAKEKLVLWREAARNIGFVEEELGVPDALRISLSERVRHAGEPSATAES
ncbi:MAG TPA: hypothetical protein VFS10_05645 [Pyrinomonadaceae bacterium]|nr:hypothetical protein [Pyrinomonadaceae bacterium]